MIAILPVLPIPSALGIIGLLLAVRSPLLVTSLRSIHPISFYTARMARRVSSVKEPNHRHPWLLRTRRERPGRCSAEQRDELAPLHSITSAVSSNMVLVSLPIVRSSMKGVLIVT